MIEFLNEIIHHGFHYAVKVSFFFMATRMLTEVTTLIIKASLLHLSSFGKVISLGVPESKALLLDHPLKYHTLTIASSILLLCLCPSQ